MAKETGGLTPDLLTHAGQPKTPEPITSPDRKPPTERRGSSARSRICMTPVEPLAVGADDAAALIGIGKSLWHELDSSGRIPAPVKLGARCVWPVGELRAWLSAGAPAREQWEVLKNTTHTASFRHALHGRSTPQNEKVTS